MDHTVTEIFRDELTRDENILWTGKPNESVNFTPSDIFLVPFSLLWGGFAIAWEIGVLLSFLNKGKNITAGLPFLAFGGFFVIVGLYFIFGRFIYKKIRKRNTYYAVTSKRVIAVVELLGKNIKAANINTIPAINMRERSSGNGSIIFGNKTIMNSMYDNTGMELFGNFYGGDSAPSFYDIDNVRNVYNIVNDIRKD